MKIKYIFLLPVIVAFAFSGISLAYAQASGSSYTFTQNLTIGSTGADVIALQQLLINKGFLTSVSTPTGYFGYGTQVAIGKFQAANGISPASGYCGPATRAFLNTLNVPSVSQPTSAVGDQGSQPVTTSNNQICQNQYGANSIYSGANNSQGGLICGCESGYQWNSNQTACVALPAETGYQVCSSNSSNATWNGTYLSDGRYDCVCDSGYVVNSSETGCIAQSPVSAQIAASIANYEAELQTYSNALTEEQNDATNVQAEASQPCSALESAINKGTEFTQGEQGEQLDVESADCSADEQELNSIYQEENQTEQAETSAKNEILYLESLP